MEKTTQELIGVGVGVLILLIIIYLVYYYFYAHPKCATSAADCAKNTKNPLCGLAGTTQPSSTAKGRCIAAATVAIPTATPPVTVGGCPSGYSCS